MQNSQTPLGTIVVAPVPELYQHLVELLRATIREVSYPPGVALTGGSSPLGFYSWLVEDPGRFPEAVDRVVFTVSDERCVPLESDGSNYGNALRCMMDPLGVSVEHRFPWDTQRIPSEAASWYQKLWELSYGTHATYDFCMLGMGEDAHTASLFPGSPLLTQDQSPWVHFDAVEVPGKGPRLTITPRGLERCGRIVVLVVGASKAKIMAEVLSNPNRPVSEQPVNLFSAYPEKVTWLIDPAAASELR